MPDEFGLVRGLFTNNLEKLSEKWFWGGARYPTEHDEKSIPHRPLRCRVDLS